MKILKSHKGILINFNYNNPLGVINQNALLMIFLMEIYIQLRQKCQSELVEDIQKDTFRYFLR